MGAAIETDPKQVKAIAEYLVATNAHKLNQALRLFSNYRRFINNLSKIEKFKLMAKEPVLMKALNVSKPFILTTDSRYWNFSASLSQGKLGEDQSSACASRYFKGNKLKYPTNDKKLLLTAFAKEQF